MELFQIFVGFATIGALIRIGTIIRSSAETRNEILEQSGVRLLEVKERLDWILERLEIMGANR